MRKHRKALDLSEDRVAAILGLTRSAVTEMEAGRRRVPAHRLAQVADELQISVQDLTRLWIEAEGAATLELPADAHPLAVQVFVTLVQLWPRLATSKNAPERGVLAVIRWALLKISGPDAA